MLNKPRQSGHRVWRRLVWTIFALLIGVSLVFMFLNYPARKVNGPVTFGVTFSPYYQQEFGVDWKVAYQAILDDLGVRHLRLSAYWDHVEPKVGTFDFNDTDFQLDQAAAHNASVLFAVGRKLPRWPECHDPSWVSGKNKDEIESNLLIYVDTVVQRYKDHPAVQQWQIENEPFFTFGNCTPKLGTSTLQKEIEIVRKYSNKPIVITDSGEWTAWVPAALKGDILGISMYREAWDPKWGRIPFPISAGFYQKKADFISPWQKNIIVTELQTEPWGAKPITQMSQEEMDDAMSIAKFNSNVAFAKQTGFPEVYLWGVEWWYWMKTQHNNSSFWDAGKKLFTPEP